MPDTTRTDALMALADSYAIAMAGYVAGNHSHLANQSAIKDDVRAKLEAAITAAFAEVERDAARLDSGCIILSGRDSWGEDCMVEHRGVNLRAAIDSAIAAAGEG